MRRLFDRGTLRDDAVAGVVLGVESVPDGLAFGFLAGVSPLAGLSGYLYGRVGGALLSSTSVMAVQPAYGDDHLLQQLTSKASSPSSVPTASTSMMLGTGGRSAGQTPMPDSGSPTNPHRVTI